MLVRTEQVPLQFCATWCNSCVSDSGCAQSWPYVHYDVGIMWRLLQVAPLLVQAIQVFHRRAKTVPATRTDSELMGTAQSYLLFFLCLPTIMDPKMAWIERPEWRQDPLNYKGSDMPNFHLTWRPQQYTTSTNSSLPKGIPVDLPAWMLSWPSSHCRPYNIVNLHACPKLE